VGDHQAVLLLDLGGVLFDFDHRYHSIWPPQDPGIGGAEASSTKLVMAWHRARWRPR
jgi:hypothetical protein